MSTAARVTSSSARRASPAWPRASTRPAGWPTRRSTASWPRWPTTARRSTGSEPSGSPRSRRAPPATRATGRVPRDAARALRVRRARHLRRRGGPAHLPGRDRGAAARAASPCSSSTSAAGRRSSSSARRARRRSFHVSTQAGAVRQTERHIGGDPPAPGDLQALAAEVRGIIAGAVPEDLRRSTYGIAVAGTATSVAAIDQELDPYDPERVHGYELQLAACERVLAMLAALPEAERREVNGPAPGPRADDRRGCRHPRSRRCAPSVWRRWRRAKRTSSTAPRCHPFSSTLDASFSLP